MALYLLQRLKVCFPAAKGQTTLTCFQVIKVHFYMTLYLLSVLGLLGRCGVRCLWK